MKRFVAHGLVVARRIAVAFGLPVAGALMIGLAGCSSYESNSRMYGEKTTYTTDPATVAVLSEVPKQPHRRIGEVHVESGVDPDPAEIDKRLREEGGALGADAVIVVHDIVRPVAADAPWWPWSDHVDVTEGRHLIALAIRYQQ